VVSLNGSLHRAEQIHQHARALPCRKVAGLLQFVSLTHVASQSLFRTAPAHSKTSDGG